MNTREIGAYLNPELARANLALSQRLNAERKARRAREQRIDADKAQLMRLGRNEEAARDMAETKARMEAGEC